ncbi:MAG: AMP-binding protein [Acidimicrobiales bacterium]
MLDEPEANPGRYDLSSLRIVLSGGAALSAPRKAKLLELLPQVTVVDGVGSSEAGGQLRQSTVKGGAASTGTSSSPTSNSVIVSDDLTHLLEAGHDEPGWLGKRGRIPLGYLGDAAKTAATFPEIEGRRYSVPGDRARLRTDGLIELLGRESVTVNSGGEKIFVEEVEAASDAPPAWSHDVVVAGRPATAGERGGGHRAPPRRRRCRRGRGLLEEAAKHLARLCCRRRSSSHRKWCARRRQGRLPVGEGRRRGSRRGSSDVRFDEAVTDSYSVPCTLCWPRPTRPARSRSPWWFHLDDTNPDQMTVDQLCANLGQGPSRGPEPGGVVARARTPRRFLRASAWPGNDARARIDADRLTLAAPTHGSEAELWLSEHPLPEPNVLLRIHPERVVQRGL